ncbi:MAG: leucine-rich repeat domain-containing protein [Saprospiraceae bacterium]|nr:leucine-rich repeat domain-containing protein [Saprospiraceae bacterium]
MFNIKWNQLTGSIPNFDKLPNLQFLNLGYNQLTGLIPNFDKLPSLKSLHLSGNRLIGSIPNYDKLPNLESLGLFENQLSGYLPDHTLTNPKLDGYRIDQNKLTFSSFIRNIKKVKTLTDVLNNLCPTCSGDTPSCSLKNDICRHINYLFPTPATPRPQRR